MRRDRSRILRNAQSKQNLTKVKSSPSLSIAPDALTHSETSKSNVNIKTVSSDHCSTLHQTTEDDHAMSLSTATKLISLFCIKLKENAHSVESLPIFLYPKINNFKFLIHFQALVKLEMVFCKLKDISGFSTCNNIIDTLQILNLSNNKIKDLYGIQNMVNLKELHIGENEIVSLNAISNLTKLEVLDFHDNQIEDLAPITNCRNSKIIRAGNNRIHTVRNHLNGMECLEILNLSANGLLFYDEIDTISTIPNLTNLQLNDPHFGSNPICDLSNYHIYSLYKLKQIQSLDGIRIDNDSKKKAQVSMYKKTMFYQILYNCAKRDGAAMYRALYRNTLELYRLLSNNIQFAYKYTSICNINMKEHKNNIDIDIAVFKKEMDECIKKYNAMCNEIWDDLQSIQNEAEKETRNKFEILKDELKTAGNLRLMECNNDVNTDDYQMIESLIQRKVQNPSNIHILKAIKIENKFANYAFYTFCEKMNHSVNQKINDTEIDKIFVIDEFPSTDSTEIFSWILQWKDFQEPIKIKSSTSIHKSSEPQFILFVKSFSNDWSKINNSYQLQPLYMVQWINNNDNAHVIDNKWGKCIQNIFDIGKYNIPKTVSKLLQYLYSRFCRKWSSRLISYLKQNEELEMKINTAIESKKQSIQIVTNESIHIMDCDSERIEHALKQNTKHILEYVNINISFNKCISNPSHEMLSVMKNVEKIDLRFNSLKCIPNIFENMNKLKEVNLQGNHIDILNDLMYFGRNSELTHLNLCNNPIVYEEGFVNMCLNIMPSIEILNNETITLNQKKIKKSPTNNEEFIDLFCSHNAVNIKSAFDEYTYVVDVIPTTFDDYKHNILCLNLSLCKLLFIPPIIKDLVNLETLNVSNNFILHIDNIYSNKNLKELILSNNKLTSINITYKLEKLNKLDIECNNIVELHTLTTPNLKFISCQCNQISSISLLSNIINLVEVNAAYNNISESNDIYSFSNLRHIAILDLVGNVLNDYKYFAIFCMKSLRMLDGERITKSDIEHSSNMYNGRMHRDFLLNKIEHKDFDTVDILDLSSCNLSILDKIIHLFTHLQELDLRNNNISDITALLQLKTLRILNLNHNSIVAVDGSFMLLANLEQLRLSDNKIEDISSLHISGMTQLKYLWLENNKITQINGLKRLPRLHTVHLNNNKIRKLSSTLCVPNLKELNIQNNGLRSIEYIDTLFTNIEILNISNNRINHLREFKFLQNLSRLFQIIIENNPIASSSGKTSQCMMHILKYSNSVQYIGNIDLTELRSQQKLQILNDKLDHDYNDNYYRDTSSSTLLALQNPIGLKIRQFPLSANLKK